MSSRLGFPFDHMPIWDAAVYFQVRHSNVAPVPPTAVTQVALADPNRFWLYLVSPDILPADTFTPLGISNGQPSDPPFFTNVTFGLVITWWDHGPLVQQAWNFTPSAPFPGSICVTEQIITDWPKVPQQALHKLKVPACPDLMTTLTGRA